MLIRLIGEISPGIIELREAQNIAKLNNLDLILISDKAELPVYRIIDESKFIYEKKKFDKLNKKNQKTEIKEIKLSPNISENDFNIKVLKAIEFHKKRSIIKVSMLFRGREIQFKEIGETVIYKFIVELDKFYKPDRIPVLEGKKIIVSLTPK